MAEGEEVAASPSIPAPTEQRPAPQIRVLSDARGNTRTPAGHFVSDRLCRRDPYNDPKFIDQRNPEEISLGFAKQEIGHLVDIVAAPSSKAPSVRKALSLLTGCVKGREEQGYGANVVPILIDLLYRRGQDLTIVLPAIVALDSAVSVISDALLVCERLDFFVSVLELSEVPLRFQAAKLLDRCAQLCFVDGFEDPNLARRLVRVTADTEDVGTLVHLYGLLAQLGSRSAVRVPFLAHGDIVQKVVNDLESEKLQAVALSLCSSVALDASHEGKLALLNAGVVDKLPALVANFSRQSAALSLTTLLAVPKEGKESLSRSKELASTLEDVSERGADITSRRVAYEARILIAELPAGRAAIGAVVDPAVIPRAANSSLQVEGVIRRNPKLGTQPDTFLLPPWEAQHVVKPSA